MLFSKGSYFCGLSEQTVQNRPQSRKGERVSEGKQPQLQTTIAVNGPGGAWGFVTLSN